MACWNLEAVCDSPEQVLGFDQLRIGWKLGGDNSADRELTYAVGSRCMGDEKLSRNSLEERCP